MSVFMKKQSGSNILLLKLLKRHFDVMLFYVNLWNYVFCHKKKPLKCLILSLKTWQISFLFFLANTFCNISYYPSFCQFPNRLSFGGIVLRHYLEANVSRSTRTSIRYFMKMLANISETIIFMFLGLSAIVDTLDWNLSFIFFALLFCLVFRVLGIYMINMLILCY